MNIAGYEFPEELYYDENHCWIRDEGETLVMGLDEFGQKLAGDIVYVQLPPDGKKLKQGKSLAKVESGKWLGKVISPVDGELVEVNEDLEINPALINQGCYDDGWMYRIKASDRSGLDKLVHGAEALTAWMNKELEKYKDQM